MTSQQLTSYSAVKTERFTSKIRNKTRMPTLITFIQCTIVLEVQSQQSDKKKN